MPDINKQLVNQVLDWWEEHKYDEVPCNMYSTPPAFVQTAQTIGRGGHGTTFPDPKDHKEGDLWEDRRTGKKYCFIDSSWEEIHA